MKKIILAILMIGLLVGAGVAAWQVYLPIQEDNESVQAYTDLRQYVHKPAISLEVESSGGNRSEPEEQTENPPSAEPALEPEQIEVDFASLKEVNPEIVAWITIPGTNIDYPVTQHSDNDYYLHHLFTGEWNSSGCIFLDSQNNADFSDCHTSIYGHHMDNGTMFQNLMGYKSHAFYDKHPTGQLITPEGSHTIEFFAGYVASVEDDAWRTGFASDEEFARWLMTAQERSLFSSPVKPTAKDRIVTLSTCSYEFYDARFVLVGRVF